MYLAAYLGHGYRASSMEGISVHIRRPAHSAVSSARRAPSRGGSAFRRVSARAVVPLAAVGGLAALSLATPAAGVSAVTAAVHKPSVRAVPDIGGPVLKTSATAGPAHDHAQCQAEIGINCYTPVQYRVAYDLNPLYAKGITGAGRTIVIVDSFGSPTIANDLHVFDQQFGFPDPTLVIDKFGNIPPFDPTNATEVGWAEETTLDVEYAHSIAPGAKIVLAETPVAETEGVTGLPEMMNAEQSLINSRRRRRHHRRASAPPRTRSPASAAATTPACSDLRYAFKDAAAHSVTVLASSGDDGATNTRRTAPPCTRTG